MSGINKKLFMSPVLIENYSGTSGKKILIVADCRLGEAFCSVIASTLKASLDILFIDTSLKTQTSTITRHISYITLAKKARSISLRYCHVIFWQQYTALHWCTLSKFYLTSPAATLLPLIFIKRNGLLGRFSQKYFSLALGSEAIKVVICHSENELNYYKKIFPSLCKKIHFVPFGMDYPKLVKNPTSSSCKYYFSGGASNRDYEIIIKSALVLKDTNFKIACKPENVPKNIRCPDNVQFIFDAYGEKFERLMADSEGVIVTLKDLNISAGQIVVMRAMAMGKVVIASDSRGLSNYVNDNNAYLVDSNEGSLVAVIDGIHNDESEANNKSAAVLNDYRDRFSSDALASNIAECVLSVLEVK